jgi:hypothetical protein
MDRSGNKLFDDIPASQRAVVVQLPVTKPAVQEAPILRFPMKFPPKKLPTQRVKACLTCRGTRKVAKVCGSCYGKGFYMQFCYLCNGAAYRDKWGTRHNCHLCDENGGIQTWCEHCSGGKAWARCCACSRGNM